MGFKVLGWMIVTCTRLSLVCSDPQNHLWLPGPGIEPRLLAPVGGGEGGGKHDTIAVKTCLVWSTTFYSECLIVAGFNWTTEGYFYVESRRSKKTDWADAEMEYQNFGSNIDLARLDLCVHLCSSIKIDDLKKLLKELLWSCGKTIRQKIPKCQLCFGWGKEYFWQEKLRWEWGYPGNLG